MLQAETEEELQNWITAFNSSKRLALENTYGQSEHQSDGERPDSASKRLSLVSSKAKSTTVVTTDASFPATATSTTVLPSGETSTTTSIVAPSLQSTGYFPRSANKNFMSTHSLTTSSSLTSLLVRDVSKENLHKPPNASPTISQSATVSSTHLPATENSSGPESGLTNDTSSAQAAVQQSSTWGIPWALVPGINMFSNPADGTAEGGAGSTPVDPKTLVVWPAHIETEVEKVTLAGYESEMEAKNHELRRLFGGVASEEVVIDGELHLSVFIDYKCCWQPFLSYYC
jgi:hypothetical protein